MVDGSGGEEFLEFIVYDSKIKKSREVGRADITKVGRGKLDMAILLEMGELNEWFDLHYKKKAAGKILIQLTAGVQGVVPVRD